MAVMAVWFSCAKKTGKDHRISREPVRPETDPFDENNRGSRTEIYKRASRRLKKRGFQ